MSKFYLFFYNLVYSYVNFFVIKFLRKYERPLRPFIEGYYFTFVSCFGIVLEEFIMLFIVTPIEYFVR